MTDPTPRDPVRDLLALAKAATPGPWTTEPNGEWLDADEGPTEPTLKVIGPNYIEVPDSGYYIRENDAAYIAAASPDVVMALAARVAAADESRAALERQVGWLKGLARPTCSNCGQSWATFSCGMVHALARQALGIEWDGIEPGLALPPSVAGEAGE